MRMVLERKKGQHVSFLVKILLIAGVQSFDSYQRFKSLRSISYYTFSLNFELTEGSEDPIMSWCAG
jgi:hypothetical protein